MNIKEKKIIKYHITENRVSKFHMKLRIVLENR